MSLTVGVDRPPGRKVQGKGGSSPRGSPGERKKWHI